MSAAQQPPHIAIIGGGPSGLCLGVLLHKRGFPFTIYELREKPADNALSQPSGMLDLHEESGLAAIRACGLYDQFVPLTAECSQISRVLDKDGNVAHADDGFDGNRPEISRNALNHLLLSTMPPESIRWGHKLLAATRATDGRVTLDFGFQGIVQCDFVVGADGAWSKTRPLVTDVKPHHGGIHYITLTIVEVTERHPDIAAMVGSGSCFILGLHNGVISHRGAQDSASFYVGISSEDETALPAATAGMTTAQLREKLLSDPALFGRWGSKTRALITAACDEEAKMSGPLAPPLKPLYMLPIGQRWEAQPGVALIGDAAHLMMPWAGEGVNLALWDSLDLAEAIATGWERSGGQKAGAADFCTTMIPLIAAFDNKMFERSQQAAEETWRNSKVMFAEEGAKAMANLFASFVPPPQAEVQA